MTEETSHRIEAMHLGHPSSYAGSFDHVKKNNITKNLRTVSKLRRRRESRQSDAHAQTAAKTLTSFTGGI